MKKFAAEFILILMVGILAACTALAAWLGWHFTEEAQARAGTSLQAERELGIATGLARGADAAARVQAADFAQFMTRGSEAGTHEQQATLLRRQHDAIRAQLAEASQILARYGLGTGVLTQAQDQQEKVLQAYLQRLQAVGGTRTTDAERWADVGAPVGALAQQHAGRRAEEAAAQVSLAGWTLLAVTALTVLVGWFLRNWIRRVNAVPMRTTLKLLQRVAAGDLTVRADALNEHYTRRLAESIDGMTTSLRTLVGEVTSSARTVADTSAQIAQGNLDLSQRTEEQASTLEETASSIEQLTSTVAHNADNARQASQLAVSASDVARRGGQVVGQFVSTMNDISASSRRIGDIIGVIDGIAFQTNILALNAAVEAARAGEQGRGFAVVASEVRNLAQRSAAAAKEVKTLIGDSVSKVENGTKLVDSAGRTMEEIVTSVKKVSDLIAEIAAASQEQSAGIGQVNTAVTQMEHVVQQNASLVEEATAATESMKEQAAVLLQMVSRFKVDEDAPAAEPTTITPLRPVPRPASPPSPGASRPASALPPASVAALDSRRPRAAANGGWEEF